MRLARRYGWLLVAPAGLLLVVFLIAPLLYFLRFSLDLPSRTVFAIPALTSDNFTTFFASSYYTRTLVRTVVIALASTALTLVLALPVAYLITKSSGRAKSFMIIATVFPLLVGNVVRAIGWVALLGYSGAANSALMAMHIISTPLQMLHSTVTVTVAVTSVVLPVMVLTLHASMELVDPATERAALSLGSPPLRAFCQVTFPQILPGIVAGTSLVFVMNVNSYATPLLVGGSQVPMLAPSIYRSITRDNNWPFAAAMAAVILVVSLTAIIGYGWLLHRHFRRWRERAA